MGSSILMLGKLAFAAIGLAVGVRLGATVREQGAFGLPSVALGAICVGGAGMLLMALADVSRSAGLLIAAEAGVRGGMILLCVFIAGTFRPSPIGAAAATLAGVLLVGTIVWDLRVQLPLDAYDYTRPSSHANQLSIAIPFLWATLECAVIWLQGRKRLKFGLADPLVIHRYLLWSVTTACFVGICGLAILAGLLTARELDTAAEAAQGLRGVLYLAITCTIWLGLFRKTERPEPATS